MTVEYIKFSFYDSCLWVVTSYHLFYDSYLWASHILSMKSLPNPRSQRYFSCIFHQKFYSLGVLHVGHLLLSFKHSLYLLDYSLLTDIFLKYLLPIWLVFSFSWSTLLLLYFTSFFGSLAINFCFISIVALRFISHTFHLSQLETFKYILYYENLMIIYSYFFPLNIYAIVVTDFIFENIVNLTQTVTILLKQLSFKCIQIMKKNLIYLPI